MVITCVLRLKQIGKWDELSGHEMSYSTEYVSRDEMSRSNPSKAY